MAPDLHCPGAMRIRASSVWLAAGWVLVGCGNGGSADKGSSGASSGHAAGGGSGSPVTESGKPLGASGAPSASGSAIPPGVDAGPAPPAPTASIRNIGRHGETLVIDVTGSDPAGQTTEAQVQLLNSSGAPVFAFDTNWDGKPDSGETLLHFDSSTLGQKTFTATITLDGLYASFPTIASATVALSNVWDETSPAVPAMLTEQTVSALNAACDVNEVTNRCDAGLSCAGTPPTCQPAPAPSFTHVGYYGSPSASEVFEGADPAGALATINVAFLDAVGDSVSVDRGDGTLVPSVSLAANGATDPTFSYANTPAQGFTSSVARIAATPVDSLGRMGATVTADLATQPLAPNGQACDATGLVGCYQGSACSPGLVSAKNVCGGVPALQLAKCAAAPMSTTQGVLAAWGTVQGTMSLWDPPTGCALPTEVGHAEAVVSLQLTKAVSTLTLSTAVPETTFDTILYVLPSCASSTAQALGCNDDATGYASTVTLANVAAGSYVVVIDSASSIGGQFGLTVATQP